MIIGPNYEGNTLVNLVAELELRLTGSASSPPLQPGIASLIPDGSTYVLIVFDGLGTAQLGHPAAGPFRGARAANLDAPFPTTTSVALAAVATGVAPSRNGLIGHLVWLPELGRVVNTLKWVDLTGTAVEHDYASVLPGPNLWERLRRGGVEPITIQPGPYLGSPLSRLLYRGARFEPVWNRTEMVDAAGQLAAEPGRLILAYFWEIDFAGHVHGLSSEEYQTAMEEAVAVWERISASLPAGAVLLGTSDHGLIEYDDGDKILVRDTRFGDVRFAGDPRGVQVWGDPDAGRDLAELTGGTLADPMELLGPDPTPMTRERSGQGLVLAPEGKVILPPGFDKRLRCYHGGVAAEERDIPLLVG